MSTESFSLYVDKYTQREGERGIKGGIDVFYVSVCMFTHGRERERERVCERE
jgi:hypothetical protein